MERLIKVNDNMLIGEGDFAKVFRISKYRVVKTYCFDEITYGEAIRRGEIRGSRMSVYCLPILEKVRVYYKKNLYPGVIKRYIPPSDICDKDVDRLRKLLSRSAKARDNLLWDLREDNIGKTKAGKLFLIDTQMEEGWEDE